jgi:hypothetical protein
MPGIDHNLKYVTANLSELKDYLLSKELFWPLNLSSAPGNPPYPKLTPGNLLLSLARLKAFDEGEIMDAAQNSELTRLEMEFDTLKRKWLVAWEKKVDREFTSRLRQWGHYLKEVAGNPDNHTPYYRNEVCLRVLLELLLDELGEDSHPELTALDTVLRAKFKGGEFLWDEDLAEGFLQEKYWFLWGDVAER